MICILDQLTTLPLRTWNKTHQNQRESSGSVGAVSVPFPLSLIMRKPIALEQARKGTGNVGQDILLCFTQPIDLEVTWNMLTVIVPFKYILNILTSLLNFGHGIKDLIQFPQSLWRLGKKSLDKPKKPCSMSTLSTFVPSTTFVIVQGRLVLANA